mmetsp:Transcript_67388/g.213307  ORF Transcript_67388/g.213307 Transcript_67388/m.213307 type:complete len:214 (+) Transcript_67388:433-1074(+)
MRRKGGPFTSGTSIEAKVRGLPGFILTRPKCTVPQLSSSGLTRSRSPMETPPLVSSTSAPLASAARNLHSRSPSVSLAIPRSTTSHPRPSAAARSIARFESRICPGPSLAVLGSTISSPVESTATVGRGCAHTCVAPTVARSPTSAACSLSPARSTLCPALMSKPTGRISAPACTASRIFTMRFPSTSAGASFVRSTITTASAPGGTGPPVVM